MFKEGRGVPYACGGKEARMRGREGEKRDGQARRRDGAGQTGVALDASLAIRVRD